MSYTLEETNFPFSHFHHFLITPSAAHSHTLVGSYDIPFPSRRSNMPEPPKKRFKERGGSEEGKGETIKTFSLSFFPFPYSLNISLLSSLKSLFAKNGLAPFSRFGQSNPKIPTLVCLFPFYRIVIKIHFSHVSKQNAAQRRNTDVDTVRTHTDSKFQNCHRVQLQL